LKSIHAYIIAVILMCLAACDVSNSNKQNSDPIAEAFGHKLYESDIESYIQSYPIQSDRQFAVSQYIDKWLMEVFLIEEAKKKIKDRKNINTFVKRYERSLIIQELENTYVQNELDTFIKAEEIDSFFNFRKEDFLLQESIIRFLFIKVQKDLDNDTLTGLWETEDLPALNQYVAINNGLALIDPQEWYSVSTIKNIVPLGLYAKISLKRPNTYTYKENDQHFYLKVLEIISEKDAAPVSFVRERIKLRILQDRIRTLLKNKKTALFNAKINSKQIKIYGKENN